MTIQFQSSPVHFQQPRMTVQVSQLEGQVLEEYRLILANLVDLNLEITTLMKKDAVQGDGAAALMANTLRTLETRIVLVNQLIKAATYSVLESGNARPRNLA